MAKQEIREFGDFTGENDQGYVIVGGKTADIEGGKKLLSDIVPVVPEQVNADWNAESGKAQILNKPTIPSKTSDLTNDSNFITLNDIPAQAQADWDEKDDSEPSFIANKPFDEVNGSGGLDIIQGSLVVQIDKKTIKRTDGGTLYVANPVPEPLSDHSDRGKVLTVQQASDPNDPDEIVWQTPQGGGSNLPSTTTANAGDVLTLDSNKNLSWSAPQGCGADVIYLNTNTMTATLNGNPITPGEVMELVKTNPYIVLRKCWDYQGVTYYGYDNYYVANYLNGEQQLLYFVCQDYGSGDTVYADAVRANNCNPSNPIWENV